MAKKPKPIPPPSDAPIEAESSHFGSMGMHAALGALAPGTEVDVPPVVVTLEPPGTGFFRNVTKVQQ